MQDYEMTGTWWLPNLPETKMVGTYVYSKGEGGKLSIWGSIADEKVDLIHGVSEIGKKITLFKCFKTSSSFFNRLNKCEVFANYTFIGVHFPSLDNINFKSVSVMFTLLDEWANISGFDISENYEKKEVQIRYKLPERKLALKTDEYAIYFSVKASGPSRDYVQKEATISQETFIDIEFEEENPDHNKVLSLIYHLQNFISLATSKPVSPVKVLCTSESGKKIYEDKEYFETINFIYTPTSKITESEQISPRRMLFNLGQVFDEIEMLLGNWLEKAENLEPVYNLYFGVLYKNDIYG